MSDFEKLERFNCQIDVWIDEEEYEQVFTALILEPSWEIKLQKAFENPICTGKKDQDWLDLLEASSDLPIKKIRIDEIEVELHSENKAWANFFSAKLIRAKIQEKGTDCYFQRLDEVVAYLERHLPTIRKEKEQTHEGSTRLAVISLLEMAAAGEGADQRSFSERARRILRNIIDQNDKDFIKFYDLLARYNIGVGYFHERIYYKALTEFNYIIFWGKKKNISDGSFFKDRFLKELIYQPAILYRADIQLKMQLAYHALNTITLYLKGPSKYKEVKANLIKIEAYQQMGRYALSFKFIKKIAGDINIDIKEKDDVAIVSANLDEKFTNIRSRLQNLIMAYYMYYLKDCVEVEEKKSYCEKIIELLDQFKTSTLYKKSNRHGYLEQVAELIGLLLNNKEIACANLIYSVSKVGILKEEVNMTLRCPCKEEGIDLRRLSAEHYDIFSKNIRKYYESSSTDISEEKEKFLKRLNRIEEKQLNRAWHKWEINLERNKPSFPDWGKQCLSHCPPKQNTSLEDKNGFSGLLYCAGPSNTLTKEYLKAKDYETLMDNWDEHFLKHLNETTVHDPCSNAIHFLGLQRWNSTSPAQGRSLGGGYLIYHTDKNGSVDLGIAVDPGFDFIRNLFHVGFSLADIDIVILSHAHVDHVRDFESMLGLLLELKNRDSQQQKLHAIMTLGVYDRLQYLIDSPGLREFVEPYIVDIEKEINSKYLLKTKFEFTQTNDSNKIKKRKRFNPIIRNISDKKNAKLRVSIKPTKAYHNDYSDHSDTYGFIIRIDDYDGKKSSYRIGYTSDTRWHDKIMNEYKGCDALLMHLGSLIDRKKGDGTKFEHYKTSKQCFKLIRKKNHPYLMGILNFIYEINNNYRKKPLILLSEFGEEMRGKIRLDLVERLKLQYKNTNDILNILPVDVGLDVLLFKRDKDGQSDINCPIVWCIQCRKFVPLDQVDFETYGYDEALYCVCKTCKKSAPTNVLQDSLRSLYEEGRDLRVSN